MRGFVPVLVTPFDERGEVDVESLKSLLLYYRSAGCNWVVALGESAERDFLSREERRLVLRTVVENWRGGVVAGVAEEGVESAVAAAREAVDMGAEAIMLAPPKKPEMGEGAVYEFYAGVLSSIDVPVVIQDYPATGRPKMSPGLIAKLHAEFSNASYLKEEDAPTPLKIREVKALTGGALGIFSAYYGRYSLWDLEAGAIGVMTAFPAPEYMNAMYHAFVSGNREKAAEIFYRLMPLIVFFGEKSLGVRKGVLALRGVIKSARMRRREAELAREELEWLRELLQWIEGEMYKLGIAPLRP